MNELGNESNIQFHIYEGIGHAVPDTAMSDMVTFFKANHGDEIVKIVPYKSAYKSELMDP